MIVSEGVYATRDGNVVVLLRVRASGFLEGQKIQWSSPRLWAPGGYWLSPTQESGMDLVSRLSDFT
jgi:hypothetical protein